MTRFDAHHETRVFERTVVISTARKVVEVEIVFHAARLHDEVDKGTLFVRPQGVEGAGIGIRVRFALIVVAVTLRVGKGGADDPAVGDLRVCTDFDRVELVLHASGAVLIFAAKHRASRGSCEGSTYGR